VGRILVIALFYVLSLLSDYVRITESVTEPPSYILILDWVYIDKKKKKKKKQALFGVLQIYVGRRPATVANLNDKP
jgi:hypothetical protein